VWQCSQALFILEFARGPHIITPSDDLTQMNIEELMNVVVTSVSRHEQSLSKTAAIFVITEEDIRRSGATTFPTSSAWFQACKFDFSLEYRGKGAWIDELFVEPPNPGAGNWHTAPRPRGNRFP
jgi:hypothetical protein